MVQSGLIHGLKETALLLLLHLILLIFLLSHIVDIYICASCSQKLSNELTQLVAKNMKAGAILMASQVKLEDGPKSRKKARKQ
eukprot:1785622-Pyramimonas_sp.AAC.1